MQAAHPLLAMLVSQEVEHVVAEVLRGPGRPEELVSFLRSRCEQRRVHGDLDMSRTPRGAMVRARKGAVEVRLTERQGCTLIDVKDVDAPSWPTFHDLRFCLRSLWWLSMAVRESLGTPVLHFRTIAWSHRPVAEVLNSLASMFVRRHILEDIQ
jgi:hypothetical protein